MKVDSWGRTVTAIGAAARGLLTIGSSFAKRCRATRAFTLTLDIKMKASALTLVIALAALTCTARGQVQDFSFQNQAEQELFAYWELNRTLNRNILECLLIAEGRSDQLPRNEVWLSAREAEVKKYIDADQSILKKAEGLYVYVHESILRKFSGEATATMLMTSGEYSCVTSTALYYHLGSVMGLPVMFHATPFHVCPIISYQDKKIWVELTQPKEGFDIEYDRRKLVEVLLENKLVTKEELDQKGEEATFNDFIHGHYQTSIAAILGLHYYNHALGLDEQGRREEAFWALAKAYLLEHEDQVIEEVFDASFYNLSSLPKLSTSYFKAASAYFTLRGKDTTAVADAITSVSGGIENLLQTQRDFGQADSILTMLERTVVSSSSTEQPLAELRRSVTINKALELERTGKYQESFDLISAELKKDTANTKLQDVYVHVGMACVEKLLTSGKDGLAIALIDTMYKRMPDYARLRESYGRVLAASVMISGKYRTSPVQACRNLMKAFDLDSTNVYVREALASVHHELAMAEIRKSNWRSARSHINQGLRFSPNNEFLKSDLALLQKEGPKPKK